MAAMLQGNSHAVGEMRSSQSECLVLVVISPRTPELRIGLKSWQGLIPIIG